MLLALILAVALGGDVAGPLDEPPQLRSAPCRSIGETETRLAALGLARRARGWINPAQALELWRRPDGLWMHFVVEPALDRMCMVGGGHFWRDLSE